MVQQGQIDHLLQETGQILPPPHVARQATLQDYETTYARSIADPEAFWEGVAQELDWFRPWDKVFQWDYPTFQWFLGAQCKHHPQLPGPPPQYPYQEQGRPYLAGVKTARSGFSPTAAWPNSSTSSPTVSSPWASARATGCVIYMPLAPEGAIAMLACARIGAIHSVVYAGFSVGALPGPHPRRPGQGPHHRRRRLPPGQPG